MTDDEVKGHIIDEVKVSITEKIKNVVRDELREFNCPTGRVHSEAIKNIGGDIDAMEKKTEKIFNKIDGINATLLGVAGTVILELIGIIVIIYTVKGS